MTSPLNVHGEFPCDDDPHLMKLAYADDTIKRCRECGRAFKGYSNRRFCSRRCREKWTRENA